MYTLSMQFNTTNDILRAATLLAQLETEHPSTTMTQAEPEQLCGEQQPLPEPAPVETAQPVVEAALAPMPRSSLETAIDMLEDPRFTYRTAKALGEKLGLSNVEQVVAFLDDNDVEYETLRRRSDDALLIALSSRV